jgi:hypothetical protein
MKKFRFDHRISVDSRGAAAGCVLRGASPANNGLRLQIMQPQTRGGLGPIQGRFVILDAGDNKHSDSLSGLLGRETDAEEVLRVIRETSPGCVSVVNVNILALEGT